jgi:hypothetical protein
MGIESELVSRRRVGSGRKQSALDAVDGTRGDVHGRTTEKNNDVGLVSRLLMHMEQDDSCRAVGANVWTGGGQGPDGS